MKRLNLTFSLCIAVFLALTAASASGGVTIIVNPGPFDGIEEAAKAEKSVDFWDGDLSDDRGCTESFAALELKHFLAKCTGLSQSQIVLSSTRDLPGKGDVFILGSRKSNRLVGQYSKAEAGKLTSDESFCISAFEDKGRTVTVIEGGDRIGTLYGVYGYLERLGIRFYGLGQKDSVRSGKIFTVKVEISDFSSGKEKVIEVETDYKVPSHGTVYPDRQIKLPVSLNVVENPSFIIRGYSNIWEYRGNEEFFLWMARNRMNLWAIKSHRIALLKKLGIKLSCGGHKILNMFFDPNTEYPYNHPVFIGDEDKPDDPYGSNAEFAGDSNGDGKLSYFEAHPEWYGMINGKRSDHVVWGHGHNFCTSNSDAVKEFANNMIASLIDGYWRYADMIDLWLSDNGKWCQCENCKTLGTCTDRLLKLANDVSSHIQQARSQGRLKRNVQISTLAYLETITAPTRALQEDFDYDNVFVTFFPITRCYVHSFNDPACSEINQSIASDYKSWIDSYYKGAFCIGEYYNVSSIKTMPVVFTRIMAVDIPWYHKTGARLFNYMHTPTRLWGTWTLNQYLLSRLLWDKDTDVDKLVDEYFRRYYPTTAEHARKFYRLLETTLANIKSFKHVVDMSKDQGKVERYALRARLTDSSKELFPMEHLRYESTHRQLNDGPDFVEMVSGMQQARAEIDAALMQCGDEIEKLRLIEDERRFTYGESMVYFYYHLVRTAIFDRNADVVLARNEFKRVEQFAEILRSVTDLVYVASAHANARNGFEATQAIEAYEFFKEKYDN
ncbi:DUF4838 domain-containing protein [Planctomycetota bacterium]